MQPFAGARRDALRAPSSGATEATPGLQLWVAMLFSQVANRAGAAAVECMRSLKTKGAEAWMMGWKHTLGLWRLPRLSLAGRTLGDVFLPANTLHLPGGLPCCVGRLNVLVLLLNDAQRSKQSHAHPAEG